MAFQTPQELMCALKRAYFDQRDLDTVLACMTQDVEWVGTEKSDYVKGKQQLEKLLMSYFSAFPAGVHVAWEKPSVHIVGDDVAVVTLTGTPHAAPDAPPASYLRGTLCCVKTPQGWLVSHGHTSVPNAEGENVALQKTLEGERIKQKALLDNVPGGVAMYRVKKDGRISTDYVSDGLAKICGYDNSAEIMKVVGEDSRKLVFEEDFPVVAKACRASIEKGVPTSVQYRVHGKGGTPVHITLDSVVMKNAKLGEDDVAVFYAVQTLVSKEASQKAEEQKEQVSLLNTVPAGIGVFEVDKDGVSQNYMNDAFYRLIGAKREDRTQYSGKNILATTHPKDVPKLEHTLQGMLGGEDFAQLDYRIMGGAGTWVWLHLKATVVEREPGRVKLHVAYYECTESKRQQLQLLQNQRAVMLAENQGRIAIWTYNIDKGVIEQQAQMDTKGHMGYPTYISNVPQCFIENGVHPEDADKFAEAYQKLADGEEKADALYRLRDQNTGAYNWIHMFYQRVDNNEDGERIAVGFSIEVNKQQEAIEHYKVEQKLREQMYADAVIYMEYNLTNCVYVGKNNLAERYRYGQWESQTVEEYRENMSNNVDAPYLDEVVEKMYAGNLLKAFENGESRVTCDYRSTARPQRPAQWYRITAAMVKRPDTDDVMAFVYVEDIEKEKNRQLAIEGSVEDGIESVSIICVADRQGWIVQTHNTFLPQEMGTHFVYDDAFVRHAHKAVIAANEQHGNKAALLSTVVAELEKQEIYQYSITTKLEGKPPKRQLFRFRYLDDRKSHIMLSVSDITSVYLEDQAKKRQLEDALAQVQAASHAKAEFYSRMSHDMRTPMNGILGMAELSKDETDSIVLKENIQKIEESGRYLLSLINDTLDIQRIESGKMKLEPTIVSTKDVVGNIIDMIAVTAKAKGVHLQYSKGNADLNWYIRADALRLKQIFINLLSNAVKFTPQGGTVDFEFKLLSRDGMISHDVVYVRDTGVGMSKAFLENGIFKPFSQENNAVSATYAGSGLGLSIAKSLVELMGGRIEVQSELGAGTTFAVYIDFERVSDEEAKAALQSEKKLSEDVSVRLHGKKVLLAEDHPLNAEIAKKLLQKVGCEVTWAKDGQEAVAYYADAAEHSFDAVLMDIRMPVMDGLEATEKIRALGKADSATIPIIAMTANAYEEDVQKATAAGVNAYLSKPVQPETLFTTLTKYMQ